MKTLFLSIILIVACIYLVVAAAAVIFFVATSQGDRGDVKQIIRDALIWPAYLAAVIFRAP